MTRPFQLEVAEIIKSERVPGGEGALCQLSAWVPSARLTRNSPERKGQGRPFSSPAADPGQANRCLLGRLWGHRKPPKDLVIHAPMTSKLFGR